MAEQINETLQDAHPEATLLLGELIGNFMPMQMPFNVQNLIGNWLQLIGQIILVFNAQQQLWQNGPGHYYSRCNKNIGNNAQQDNTDIYFDGRIVDNSQPSAQQLQQEIAQLQQRLEQLEALLIYSNQG